MTPYFHLLNHPNCRCTTVPAGSTFTFKYDFAPPPTRLVAGNSDMTCGRCQRQINAGDEIDVHDQMPGRPVTHAGICVLRFKR